MTGPFPVPSAVERWPRIRLSDEAMSTSNCCWFRFSPKTNHRALNSFPLRLILNQHTAEFLVVDINIIWALDKNFGPALRREVIAYCKSGKDIQVKELIDRQESRFENYRESQVHSRATCQVLPAATPCRLVDVMTTVPSAVSGDCWQSFSAKLW